MNLKLPLWPYQEEGVRYAVEKQRAFISDEVGLGKSIEALAAVSEAKKLPCLIVCPAYLKENWVTLLQRHMGEVTGYVVGPKWEDKAMALAADFVIVNYDLLERHQAKLASLDFKAIVFDESQYLKNRKAKRTKIAKSLGRKADMILCLSATPIESRPAELASQLDVMRRLPEFGGEWWFKQRYAVTHKSWCIYQGSGQCDCGKNRFGYWDFSGASNLVELNERLRERCLIRRTKAQVQKYLPELRREVVAVSIDNPRDYFEARTDFIRWLAEKNGAEAAMRAYRAEAITKMNTLRQLTVDGKIKAAEAWIRDEMESGEPLVVFLWHHRTSQKLLEAGLIAPVIDGDTTPVRRSKIVAEFQSGEHPLLLVNIKSGGLGLDLTKSSNCLFIEQGWTPAAHDQGEGRLHRHGQIKPVTAWYMIARGTIDRTIYELIEKKRYIVNAVLEGQTQELGLAGGVEEETARLLEAEYEGRDLEIA